VVTFNGTPISLSGNNFSVSMALSSGAIFNPAVAELSVAATGYKVRDRRVIIRGQSVADGALSPQSIAERLNDSAIAKLIPILKSQVPLDQAALRALLHPPQTFPVNECLISTFLGCAGGVNSYTINDIQTTGFDTTIDSQSGFVDVFAYLDNVRVDGVFDGYGLVPDCPLTITASRVDVLTDQQFSPCSSATCPAPNNDASNINVNQCLSGCTYNDPPDVNFQNFNWSLGGGADCAIVESLARTSANNTVRNRVHDDLVDYLDDPDGSGAGDAPIAGGLQSALAGLSITGSIGDALGVQLDEQLFQIAEDVNGITMGNDSRVLAVTHPPGAPDFSASLHIPEAFPSFGNTTPVNHLPYHMAIGFGASAFNQLLKALTESGLLNLDLTELSGVPITSDLLAAFVPEFGTLPSGTALKVVIAPTIAPALTGNLGRHGELEDLKISHLLVSIKSAAGATLYIQLAADAEAGITPVYVAATNEIQFNISTIDTSSVQTVILSNAIGADEESLQGLMPLLIQQALPLLSGGLGAFPLPTIFGLKPAGVEISRNGQMMTVFLNFQ
jgi:hypothetical protein